MLDPAFTDAVRRARLQSLHLQHQHEQQLHAQRRQGELLHEKNLQRQLRRAERLTRIAQAEEKRRLKAHARELKVLEDSLLRCQRAIAACHTYKTMTTKPHKLERHDQEIARLTLLAQKIAAKIEEKK